MFVNTDLPMTKASIISLVRREKSEHYIVT